MHRNANIGIFITNLTFACITDILVSIYSHTLLITLKSSIEVQILSGASTEV